MYEIVAKNPVDSREEGRAQTAATTRADRKTREALEQQLHDKDHVNKKLEMGNKGNQEETKRVYKMNSDLKA